MLAEYLESSIKVLKYAKNYMFSINCTFSGSSSCLVNCTGEKISLMALRLKRKNLLPGNIYTFFNRNRSSNLFIYATILELSVWKFEKFLCTRTHFVSSQDVRALVFLRRSRQQRLKWHSTVIFFKSAENEYEAIFNEELCLKLHSFWTPCLHLIFSCYCYFSLQCDCFPLGPRPLTGHWSFLLARWVEDFVHFFSDNFYP